MKKYQIKSFNIRAVLRRSVQGVGRPVSVSLRLGNTAPFQEVLQRWRAVGNTVFDLTGSSFESQTFRSSDERVRARPFDRYEKLPNFETNCLNY